MKIAQSSAVEQKIVEMEGSHGCKVRWLIGENVKAPNFAMREFEIEQGGHTPKHSHPYEHEVFVLEGTGNILENNQVHEIKQGDTIYVAPDEVHQFQNTGSQSLKFLCLIPNSAKDLPITLAPECGAES